MNPRLTFIEASGERTSGEARPGDSVMRAAKALGVPGIIGECNGSMTCLTCHCYVASSGAGPLPGPADDELAMLDCLLERRPTSRLSCQILVTPALDGAVFELPAWQG